MFDRYARYTAALVSFLDRIRYYRPWDAVVWQDASLVLLLVGVMLFAFPFFGWWARPDKPWYFPYLLWAALIAAALLLQRRYRNHDF